MKDERNNYAYDGYEQSSRVQVNRFLQLVSKYDPAFFKGVNSKNLELKHVKRAIQLFARIPLLERAESTIAINKENEQIKKQNENNELLTRKDKKQRKYISKKQSIDQLYSIAIDFLYEEYSGYTLPKIDESKFVRTFDSCVICDHKVQLRHNRTHFQIICPNCDAKSEHGQSEHETIDSWYYQRLQLGKIDQL